MSADGCLGLRPCFAGLDPLVPRVMKLGVSSASAVSEPRTTATTTTNFSRFRDDAAFWACGTDGRRRDCWRVCGHWSKRKDENTKTVTDWSARGSIYMALALDLRLQASTPSNHMW